MKPKDGESPLEGLGEDIREVAERMGLLRLPEPPEALDLCNSNSQNCPRSWKNPCANWENCRIGTSPTLGTSGVPIPSNGADAQDCPSS